MGACRNRFYTHFIQIIRKWIRSRMDSLRFGLGTVWLLFTIAAAAFLGTDFVLYEIRMAIRHRRDVRAK